MKSLILKNESRILVRCYREFLIKGVNDTPMQFIQGAVQINKKAKLK